MSVQDIVTYASLTAGAICFGLYLAHSISTAWSSRAEPPESVSTQAKAMLATPGISIGEFTDLLKAMAQLSDSLSKAAPSVVAMIGAILFFSIASISSGALHGAPPPQGAGAGGGAPTQPATVLKPAH